MKYLERERSRVRPIWRVLNRQFPLDAAARWWYLLVAGPAVALVFGLATDFKLFPPVARVVIVETTAAGVNRATVWVVASNWRDDLMLTVLGFLFACGVIWLLEEIRAHNQHNS